MKNVIRLCTLTFIGLAIGCQQFNLEYPPPQGTGMDAEYQTVRDKLAVKFAHQLAASLKEPDMRRFIREEVLQQFDGDYNFLLGTHLNKPVRITEPSGRVREVTFKEALFGPQPANARGSADDFLDSLQQYYPLLQIAVPELEKASAENWQIEDDIPLVAITPEEAEGITTVMAIDSEGNTSQLPVATEPDEPVIVVSANERLIGIPKNASGRTDCPILQEPYYSTPTTDYYFADDYYATLNNCNIGNPPPPPPPSGEPCNGCDRDCKNTKDELVKVKFNSISTLRKAEPWLYGKIELQALITIGNQSPSAFWGLTKTNVGKRKDYRTCDFWGNCTPIWRNINAEILTWDPNEIGDRMKYSWYEIDNNTGTVTISATVGFPNNNVTGSVTFNLGTQRYFLGESYVEYCDNADGNGTLYNTGDVSFYVKQR